MPIIKYHLDTRSQRKDGTHPIKLYVNHVTRFLISTRFSATKEEWGGGEYTKAASNHQAKNAILRTILTRIDKKMFELEASDTLRHLTDKQIKAEIEAIMSAKSNHGNRGFWECYDAFTSSKIRPRTREAYEDTKKKIMNYDANCTFESIDRTWLQEFERWMINDGLKINTIGIHMRNLRAVFNYAIDEEKTTLYPFRKYKIKKEETRKRSLTLEQLRLLRDYPCEPYQERYRDMFMLMLYLIGINAVDLFNAKELINGRLEYKRAKTGKLYSIKVEPEAMEIIERYKGKKYLLNVLDEYSNYKDFLHRMGMELKKIGECKRSGLGGKKHITPLFPDLSSYWARHTWATLAAQLDVPKETIAAALGHEIGMAVTSIYIDFNQSKIDEANRKVLDYVRGGK